MSKAKVYEVATKLEIGSQELLRRLNALGIFVRSASSTLEPADVLRVRESLKKRSTLRQASAPIPAEAPDPIEEAIRQNLGVDHLPTRVSRANRARSFPPSQGRFGDSRAPRARRQPPDPWVMRLFDSQDRQAWEAVGIHDPREAEEFLIAGITPDDRRLWGSWSVRVIKLARAAGLTQADLEPPQV